MKIYLFLFLFVAVSVFSSCKKECTCSMWTDGKDTDSNPIVAEAKNCSELEDQYETIGRGYDEATGTGMRCK